jgi:hypothetical protein
MSKCSVGRQICAQLSSGTAPVEPVGVMSAGTQLLPLGQSPLTWQRCDMPESQASPLEHEKPWVTLPQQGLPWQSSGPSQAKGLPLEQVASHNASPLSGTQQF